MSCEGYRMSLFYYQKYVVLSCVERERIHVFFFFKDLFLITCMSVHNGVDVSGEHRWYSSFLHRLELQMVVSHLTWSWK